ncbi:MAG: ABC transporter ATP-binding protein [Planctomycetes bacterium]|nr:ABC transporter ATP-binding protein [Planctomycetota bacterium]
MTTAPAGAPPILSLRGVHKYFGEGEARLHVLHGIEMEVRAGEFVAIVGQSGSGKSTLLNILGCLDRPSEGSYVLDGRDTATLPDDDLSEVRNRSIGFVFQSFQLVPQLTVLENVEVPLFYGGVARAERHRVARERLEQVGLGGRLSHRPPQLSGGEQQRVAIARALSNDPRLLLADEPTGNLDSATGEQILDLIRRLNGEGRTVVMITHDVHVAAAAKRRVRILDGRITDGDA